MLPSFSSSRLFCPTDDSSPSRKWNVASPPLSFAFASFAAWAIAFCTRRQNTSSRSYPWIVTVLGAWCVCVRTVMEAMGVGSAARVAYFSRDGVERAAVEHEPVARAAPPLPRPRLLDPGPPRGELPLLPLPLVGGDPPADDHVVIGFEFD